MRVLPAQLNNLGLFRMVSALLLFEFLYVRSELSSTFFSYHGVTNFVVNAAGVPGDLPSLMWQTRWTVMTDAMFSASQFLCVLLFIGVRVRLCAFLLFLFLLSLHHASPLVCSGGEALLRLLCLLNICLPTDAEANFARLWRAPLASPPIAPASRSDLLPVLASLPPLIFYVATSLARPSLSVSERVLRVIAPSPLHLPLLIIRAIPGALALPLLALSPTASCALLTLHAALYPQNERWGAALAAAALLLPLSPPLPRLPLPLPTREDDTALPSRLASLLSPFCAFRPFSSRNPLDAVPVRVSLTSSSMAPRGALAALLRHGGHFLALASVPAQLLAPQASFMLGVGYAQFAVTRQGVGDVLLVGNSVARGPFLMQESTRGMSEWQGRFHEYRGVTEALEWRFGTIGGAVEGAEPPEWGRLWAAMEDARWGRLAQGMGVWMCLRWNWMHSGEELQGKAAREILFIAANGDHLARVDCKIDAQDTA